MSGTEPTTSELTEKISQLNIAEENTTTDETQKAEGEENKENDTKAESEVTKPVQNNQKKPNQPQGKQQPGKKGQQPAAKKGAAANTKDAKSQQQQQPLPPLAPNSLTNMKPTEHISRKLGKRPEDLPVPIFTAITGEKTQTSPPKYPVLKFYTPSTLPHGEFQDYTQDFNTYRITSEECREKDLLREEQIRALREGAEIHRQVRHDIQKYLRPGVKLIDVANQLERSTLELVQTNGFERTRGFPTGLSLNNIAAHWTPNPGDLTVLKETDVLKVDFGVSINGNIIDCAWTTHFDPVYDPIVEAVKEGTNAGIAATGIDVRLCDVGEAMREVVESYELTLNNQTLPVKTIKNLCGHSIGPYKIHAGHSVPSYDNGDETKMTEGTLYAIELFVTNDPMAKIREEGECSHYMRNFDVAKPLVSQSNAVKLWNLINKRFSTLAFCRRWLVEEGAKDFSLSLHQLVQKGSIDPYPPLVVRRPYQTAQFEHTVLLGSQRKEVLTRSWDY